MHNEEALSPELHDALESFRWIRDAAITQARPRRLLRLQAVAASPRQPSIYETSITDQEVLLNGGTLKPVPGLALRLSASGAPRVSIGEVELKDDDFRFVYSDDLLSMTLNLDSQRYRAAAGLYKLGRIQFSPSGQTFSGMINQVCPDAIVTYRWDGRVVCAD